MQRNILGKGRKDHSKFYVDLFNSVNYIQLLTNESIFTRHSCYKVQSSILLNRNQYWLILYDDYFINVVILGLTRLFFQQQFTYDLKRLFFQ